MCCIHSLYCINNNRAQFCTGCRFIHSNSTGKHIRILFWGKPVYRHFHVVGIPKKLGAITVGTPHYFCQQMNLLTIRQGIEIEATQHVQHLNHCNTTWRWRCCWDHFHPPILTGNRRTFNDFIGSQVLPGPDPAMTDNRIYKLIGQLSMVKTPCPFASQNA